KYSTNPYNVNRMTMAAGVGALLDGEYFENNCKTIIEIREYTAEKLKQMGFTLTQSKANFLFAASKDIDGKTLYLRLKEKGILVRHFDKERLTDYNRITVGTKEQMDILISAIKEITEVSL
ncbi:MAG: aminotransferase class I/II-fold pyridoxal phosphate-dependent enzyme, partial [Oscillospiraceae bacterium]|nr:aminotransferase class I/II-fold pyridoxal phosphate-dependent enzyme [Oscillospiraceae bacterium]